MTGKIKKVLGISVGIIFIVCVIFFGARSNRKEHISYQESVPSISTDTKMPDTKVSKTVQPVSTPTSTSIMSMVTNISATPGQSSTDPKHGTFSVMFNVIAGDKDVYVSPTCQISGSSMSSTGVTFSIYKDGGTVEGIAPSCIILNHGLVSKTTNGNFLVKKGEQNPFELVVVYHPSQSGKYQVAITQVGYSTTDSVGNSLFKIAAFDISRLKTQELSL